MAEPFIQGSFASGEISPNFWGRVDSDKYQTGVELLKNFAVDYRGGAFNRSGTEFCGQCLSPSYTRLIPFKFSAEQQYVLEFGNFYMKILFNGAYIIGTGFPNETQISVISNSNPGVVTFLSPGFATEGLEVFISGGTWVGGTVGNLNGRTVILRNVAATTAQLFDHNNQPINTTNMGIYAGAADMFKLIIVATPWSNTQTPDLKFVQQGDVMRVVYRGTTVYKITRLSHTNWTVTSVTSFLPQIVDPVGITVSSNATSGATGYLYAVTAIGQDGEESVMNSTGGITGVKSFQQEPESSNKITWTAVAGAQYYNVYRAPWATHRDAVDTGSLFDFIGDTKNLRFVDNDIEGDSTFGRFLFDAADYGYPLGFPSVISVFQQRIYYASSDQYPIAFWTSKVGHFDNNGRSVPSRDDDSIRSSVASVQIDPILHMVPMPGELLAITASGVVGVSGGGLNSPVTPGNIIVNQHAYVGAAPQPSPIIVDYDILYVDASKKRIQDMVYALLAEIFESDDVTILASHLFDGFEIVDWCYCEVPHRVIWAVRNDGALLSFTFLKKQEVFAWAKHESKNGLFRSCTAIRENGEDIPYFTVQRTMTGIGLVQYVERIHSRIFKNAEDGWFVDGGAMNAPVFPESSMQAGAATGTGVNFVTNVSVFQAEDVGAVIRAFNGIATITSFINGQSVICDITSPITYTFPDTNFPFIAGPGEWSITRPISQIKNGLWHLEGMEVAVLVDGGVQTNKTVTNGVITLDAPGTRVTVGIPIQSQFKTLRLDLGSPVVASRRKKLQALTVRTMQTRGIKVGSDFEHLEEVKMEPAEELGDNIALVTGDMLRTILDSDWDLTGQICIQQDYPLPAFILAVIPEVSLGDNTSSNSWGR